ncbi:DASH complex subunit DAD1 [Lachancea thermotolerans]|uniref:DASH complex subunit DAD1 n=1 Tax=Lachancea thermotolerans (strain ATCC 56472 / CBS 6340 / NRRL Y-8284) TaxID=559295 RepID=C5DED1_LACTC|nr:KLTH0C08206p [Lachancea thermotolerans CBS 6340]CAR22142.1 KLTH0C08206p [Lachancea thermotolerans CBS 6340]
MSEKSRKGEDAAPVLSEGDKYFIEQREMILQDIGQTMDSILNNLNGLNISLENFIAVGKEFENVSELWSTFYTGISGEAEAVDTVAVNEQENLAPEE